MSNNYVWFYGTSFNKSARWDRFVIKDHKVLMRGSAFWFMIMYCFCLHPDCVADFPMQIATDHVVSVGIMAVSQKGLAP